MAQHSLVFLDMSMDDNTILDLAIYELWNRINKEFATSKTLSENLLCYLYTTFPNHSVAALDLCDHRSITLITSPSGRKIYSCTGSTGTPYLLSYTGFLCSCPIFKASIEESNMWCKHLVALQLSLAMEIVPTRVVSEEAIKDMITDMMLSSC